MLDGTLTTRADGYHEVRFERRLAQSIDKIWAALTEPARLHDWLGEVEIEPRVGGKFILRFRGSTEVMTGEITRFEAPRLIEYSWTEPHYAPAMVRWQLAAQDGGTLLTLVHIAPPEAMRSDVLGYLGGWHQFLDTLPGAADGAFMTHTKGEWAKLDEGYRVKVTGSALPDEKAQMGRTASVRFERMLPGPIENVWAHITDTNLLPAWFGEDSAIEPRQGGKVSLMGGHIRGTVTQWSPPHSLCYTWNVFNPGDPPDAVSSYPESYLTFRLERYGERVLLTLSHVPILERFEKQNATGWHTMLDILGTTLRGEVVVERSAYMKKNAALYGVDMQNLAR